MFLGVLGILGVLGCFECFRCFSGFWVLLFFEYDKVQGTRRVKKTKFKKFDMCYIWKVIPLSGREFHGESIFHKINSTGRPIFTIYLFRDIVCLTDLRSMNN